MGPDVVIAIHLQVSPTTADDIQSLFGVLGRSITISSAASEVRGMEAADIVVKVDVQKFTALDFNQADALIQKGMEAAEEKAKILQPYVLDQAEWDEYVAHRDARKRGPVGAPQFVKVEGSTPLLNKKIETLLQPMVNKPIDTKKLDNDLTLSDRHGKNRERILWSDRDWRRDRSAGQCYVRGTMRRRFCRLPLDVDGTEPENVTFTLGGRLTFLDVGGFGSEWRTDFAIGNTYGISSEFYKRFIQTSKWFVLSASECKRLGAVDLFLQQSQADYRIGRAGGWD